MKFSKNANNKKCATKLNFFNENDLKVIFDQWPKLSLGLDVWPEIPILKVIYYIVNDLMSFNSDINLLLQSMPKICQKTILLMCLISPCHVLHRLRDNFWYVYCSAQWRIWRVSIPILIVILQQICKKTGHLI